ncbi:hypothetical protein KO507_10615 [Gilvimarinus agarilyticus]|uniref:hypothetical protein n=1 Tax=Gilvimarinus sp. 2_MG-2023 TaxID=3062666 RepID=UPI001C09D92E|nr:hypothetical protein [Gilvimarinus sp. 2_MG-2023]MBU2886214.1 hypothetical protein [Gilvimarinus agarilyticus]MDO6570902.1 hypothetical protein [Gilvimarinus sp. 2_MG-2023]
MLGVTTLGLGVLLFESGFSLIILFGIHHALNEAYGKRVESPAAAKALAPVRALLHLLCYLIILRTSLSFHTLSIEVLGTGLALTVIYYVYSLNRQPRTASPWSQHQVEALSLLAVGLSIFVNINFLQVVLFHFILWAFIPMPSFGPSAKLN